MFDARFFSFGKFVLPKTTPITNTKAEIAVGYFDNVQVEKICPNQNYYNTIDKYLMGFFEKQHSKVQKDISRQNLFAFTNRDNKEYFSEKGYAFCGEKLDRFWADNDSTFNRFYSLLHIRDCKEKELYKLLDLLNQVFNSSDSNEYTAVFYFTFDYSDIIICARNMTVSEYTSKIFSINYIDSVKSDNVECHKHLIKDSFSLLVFNNEIIRKVFDYIDKNANLSYDDFEKNITDCLTNFRNIIYEDRISVVYNIGVQDYELFNEFIAELKSHGIKYEQFSMLGRHDVTIYKGDANIIWLLILLYYVDEFSSLKKNNKIDKLLFNCETFIRVKSHLSSNNIKFSNDTNLIERYKFVEENLKFKVENLINRSREKSLMKTAHYSSLNSMLNSIMGIFKNGFADDFVVCIYESFDSFLDYLIKKIEDNDISNIEEFNEVYNNYFEIISSLVNSAMHSDRQFVQAPSFNPVFYDVPPKLMAFYTVLTSDIKEINKGDELSTYSFVFKPSFLNSIAVFPYSYKQTPPTNRLLAVSINEESLYQPTNVINVMCHEVAHYVGKEQRSRDTRKEYWIKAILFVVYKMIINNINNSKINSRSDLNSLLVKLVSDSFEIIKGESYYDFEEAYSETFNIFLYRVFDSICNDSRLDSCLKKFFADNFKKIDYVECVDHMKKGITLLSYFIPENINAELKTNFSISNLFFEWYKNLLSVFRESYADIQMILLSNMSFKNYIRNLVLYENMNLSNFINDITFYRIFSVVYTLYELQYWDLSLELVPEKDKSLEPIIEFIRQSILWQDEYCPIDIEKSHNNIKKYSSLFEQENSLILESNEEYSKYLYKKEPYVINLIFCYLSDVYEKTQIHYTKEDNQKLKSEFYKKVEQVEKATDAAKLFLTIQNNNEDFLNKITRKTSVQLL